MKRRGFANRRWKCVLSMILIVCVWMGSSAVSMAENYKAPETLRVGFYYLSGYHEMDEEGNKSGYGYEYLQHLSMYGNWKYEYIGFDRSWSETLDMLENGELDIVTGVQKSEERLEKFEFSNQAIGYSNTMVTVKAGNERYLSNDFENWNGVRVGMIENYTRNDSFKKYAQENNFTYKPVYYKNTADLIKALKSGRQIDMAVSSNLRSVQGEWILAEFDPSPFYIIAQKGNTELIEQIDEAISLLNMNETTIATELWDKYYYNNDNTEIAFSVEERNFIKSMEDTTFQAVISPDCAPMSYLKDGKPCGILYDITQKIIEKTKLNIEIIPVENRKEYQEIVENRQCDICLDAWYDYSSAEEHGYALTVPYLAASLSSLRLKGNTEETSVAAVRDMDLLNFYLDKLRPDHKVVYYDTIEEAVEAVKAGKQDETLLYTRCAEYVAYQDVKNRLVTEKLYEPDAQFAIAVNNGENTMLLSILSKACASISEEEVAESMILYSGNLVNTIDTVSLMGYLYSNPLMALIAIVALFGIVILIAGTVHSFYSRKREHRRVVEETRKNKLLQDSLALSKQAVEAKGNFLSRISHEMRTPLNAIIGYTSLAQEKRATKDEIVSYANKSEVAAKQLLALINDILDAAAMENGKLKITSAPFRITKLQETMMKMFGPIAEDAEIDFQIETKNITQDCVKGDETRVSQILINLLSNAMKFTSKGGKVTLTITQQALREHYVFYEFIVTDTGIGMEEAFLKKIGEPFEQEHVKIGVKYGGTGLGVSIVKMLVTMMKGKINVRSRKNEGTEFKVEIPFERVATCESKSTEEEKAKPDFSGKEILVAEDNQMNMEIMVNMLQSTGAKVACAMNGVEVVEAFSDSNPHQFGAILMDIQMPVMDGYEAAREIRKLDRADAENIPILAITANAFEEDVSASLAAGMNEHISKPIDFHILFEKLNQLMN